MSIHENLPTAYHQQDTEYYCGAACAQIVLDQIGAGLLGQVGLYNDNHSHSLIEPIWYTGPDGLQWTLNNRKPASFANYFALFALATEDAISRKIAWTIHHYKIAPVALVYGWAHWIVVRGYEASDTPAGSGDTSYTIKSFDINNPWPPTPAAPPPSPPPHSIGDGCGIGGNRGIADEHIAYSHWQSAYMTGVPSGYWQGKFLAVCDPEPPAERLGQQAPAPHRTKGDRILSKKEAADQAIAGLNEYGLYERESWKKALSRTSPGEPILVHRLDRLDSFYYIVPMHVSKKVVPAFVCVDARFGDYLQAVAVPERGKHGLTGQHFDADTALERIIGRPIDLPEPNGQLVVRKEAHCLYPTLVWKPCRESLSPYFPFFMVTVGDHRIYIRIDGSVFSELHDQGRGI